MREIQDFTIFPFALKKSDLIEFRTRLQDEQRSRKAADQADGEGYNPSAMQGSKEDTNGGDQGDAVRAGRDEGASPQDVPGAEPVRGELDKSRLFVEEFANN